MFYMLITFVETLHLITQPTVMPAKSDSDVVFCLQLLSKTLTFTLHLG